MKKYLLLFLILVGCSGDMDTEPKDNIQSGETSLVNSITQYGITWTFDDKYEVGQFVNGDYYVVGPVNIVSISPEPTGSRNGSMVNPVTGENQGYDDRVGMYDNSSQVTFPYTLNLEESLVSTISLTDEDIINGHFEDWSGRNVSIDHAFIKTAAVLTCLSESPADGTFRPPFVGTYKPLYNLSQVQDNLLPTLDLVEPLPEPRNFGSYLDYFKRGLERPWLTHITDWQCRMMHPTENMLNYHAYIADFWSEVSLLLLLDIPAQDKEEILIKYIQTGLDMYYMCILGDGDSGFNKWPVIFTGLMLNEPDIYNLSEAVYQTREDRMTYYLTEKQSPYTSSKLSEGELWTGYSVASPRPAWAQDRGEQEHEHLDVTEWEMISNGEGKKREAYRTINSPTYVGQMLAALIMDAKTTWNHPAFFDYVDRWMSEDGVELSTAISDVFSGEDYGDPNPDDYQTSESDFVNAMWETYR
jgi:hypothetical protein